MNFYIESLETPGLVAHEIEVISAVRQDRVVICEADTFPIECIIVEYEDEELAMAFQRDLAEGRAAIKIEADVSINAAPVKLQKKYFMLQESGDEVRLAKLLSKLWDDYGVDPENAKARETSGVRRIAIMHDDGISSCGFQGMEPELRRWMTAHGFPFGRGLINDF